MHAEPLRTDSILVALPADVDVAIIGAGPLGMTLALMLAATSARVVLIDAGAPGAAGADPRALALAYGSRQLLERLGAWNGAAATAIAQVHISQRGGFGRTLLDTDDYASPALGYVMRYRELVAALAARLPAQQRLDHCRVEAIDMAADNTRATLTLRHAGVACKLGARLVIHAEGTPEDGPGIRVRDYQQRAIVAELQPARPHHNRAWERFTADGPLALLPLGEAYALIVAVPTATAECWLALDDDAFLAALHERIGGRVDFVSSGPRASYPLALRSRDVIVAPRQVWIGNSAQTLHPVAGQGMNLGLRDAWQLAALVVDALDAAADPGAPGVLAAYARGRRLDRQASMAFTDGIVRLFSNDLPPLRAARGLGLLALDLVPPLRHFVAKRMIWGARAWP